MRTLPTLVFLVGGLLQAGDNPEYTWWAGFKPGSWVKVRIEGDLDGHSFELLQTHTLAAADPDRVIVNRTGSLRLGDREIPGNRTKEVIPRSPRPSLRLESAGSETLTIGGARVECRKFQGFDSIIEAKVTFWIATSIPGGLAKGEVRPEAGHPATRISALEWESK